MKKPYPRLHSMELPEVVNVLNYISGLRNEDLGDFNDLNSRFISGRRTYRSPTSATDILPTDKEGDIVFTTGNIFWLVDIGGGTLEWRNVYLSGFSPIYAPVDGEYFVGTASGGMTNERVGTTSSSITVNRATSGQVKWDLNTSYTDARYYTQTQINNFGVKPQTTSITYSGGDLSRIDYADGTYKTFSWSAGILNQVVETLTGLTRTKTLSYSGGFLSSVTVTEV